MHKVVPSEGHGPPLWIRCAHAHPCTHKHSHRSGYYLPLPFSSTYIALLTGKCRPPSSQARPRRPEHSLYMPSRQTARSRAGGVDAGQAATGAWNRVGVTSSPFRIPCLASPGPLHTHIFREMIFI